MNKLAACGICMVVGFLFFGSSFLFRSTAAEESWNEQKAEQRSTETSHFHGKIVEVEKAKEKRGKNVDQLQQDLDQSVAQRAADREQREKTGSLRVTMGWMFRYGGCVMILTGAIGVLAVKNSE